MSLPPGEAAVGEEVWRHEAPHVLAALLRRSSHFEDCEDAVQEALLAAAKQWPRDGVPDNPRAWLVRVASRKLIDVRRSVAADEARLERHARESLDPAPGQEAAPATDDTLQMLLLCAHPSLSDTSRVALTLRSVAGLSTRAIAALLLTPEATVGQRISRAKATLRENGLRFTPPRPQDLPDRLHAVRHVVYLIFTAGHTAYDGSDLVDTSLTDEAIWMTESLHRALPEDSETAGLLALMLLTRSRYAARSGQDGRLIPLADQDRGQWDRSLIERGVTLVETALVRGDTGPFQLQAAIAAVHAEAQTAEQTDWLQITMLYRILDRLAPSPTVSLNLAAAIGMAHGPTAGLEALEPLLADERERKNHRLHATRAHLLDRAGDSEAARAAYERAAQLTQSVPEQRYLHEQAARLQA